MAARTQHEGKTERAKESHDRCSQPPGMRMPKTADLGTQAFLVVNSFKLHLNAFKLTWLIRLLWNSSLFPFYERDIEQISLACVINQVNLTFML